MPALLSNAYITKQDGECKQPVEKSMDRFSLTFNDGLQPQAARGPVCRSPVGTRRKACEFVADNLSWQY
jgi:hypothetical protein